MCGIIGSFSRSGNSGLAERVGASLDRIAHRGPDAAGLFRAVIGGCEVVLGHRRLSIIDLSEAANQPFEKDGLVLVFNGEIYNHHELRQELAAGGAVFLTSSDTEVIIEAWRYWGSGCLRRLRGMFAFALLDQHSGELVVARDPFGIKPLFLHRDRKEGVVFASELKALRPLLPCSRIRGSALVASLLYSWVPEDQCILDEVEKLPPGHWLRVTPGQSPALECYWSAQTEFVESRPAAVSIPELRQVIEESVRLHMVADVPVASLLSGGLDSSLITVLAARLAGSIDSYTVAFRAGDQRFEAMPDDLLYARQLAANHPIRLHEIEITPNIATMLPRMVDILDEPVGDPAAINVLLMCEAARQAGVKVLLSGMGADELFGGYRRHQAAMIAARYRQLPSFLRRGVSQTVKALPVAGHRRGFRLLRWGQRFLSFADLSEEAGYRRSYTYYDQDELDTLMLGRHSNDIADTLSTHADIYARGPGDDQVNRMCFTDLHLFLSGLNLTYTDRASMAASTEVRVPFVDLKVARAAFGLLGRDKISGGHSKRALKIAAEAWLPREIIYRPKASFGVPLRAWIRGDLRAMVDDLLPNGRLVGDGWLDGAGVGRLIADDRSGRHDNAQRLWHLMTLELWLRNWHESQGATE